MIVSVWVLWLAVVILTHAMIHNGVVVFKIESREEKFHISLLKDKQIEA